MAGVAEESDDMNPRSDDESDIYLPSEENNFMLQAGKCQFIFIFCMMIL